MSVRDAFAAAAAARVLVKDGPFGTEIQRYALPAEAYGGTLGLAADQKGNNDLLALTRPDVIQAITDAYLEAGADVIATNTFSANAISQADYAAEALVGDINRAAAGIARACADAATARDGRPRFVAGAVGPTNKTLSLSPKVEDPGYREIDFPALVAVYREQVDALIDGGVDTILIETVFDTLNAKAAIAATLDAADAVGRDVPMMLSMTLTDLSGRNLSGHTIGAFWTAVRHARPLTVGLNCSFGAEQLRPHIRELSAIADTHLMAYPNAGLPNALGQYDEAPETTAGFVAEWARDGRVNVLGGCCGATPAHIRAIADAVAGVAPRTLPTPPPALRLAGLEPFEVAA